MMDQAAVLIVVPGLSPGLDWELERVADGGRLNKTIFVFVGNDREEKLARVHACIGAATEGGHLQAPDPFAAWLAHVGKDSSWVTIACGSSSTGEVQAGLDLALYGVLIERERARAASISF